MPTVIWHTAYRFEKILIVVQKYKVFDSEQICIKGTSMSIYYVFSSKFLNLHNQLVLIWYNLKTNY